MHSDSCTVENDFQRIVELMPSMFVVDPTGAAV